MTARNVVANGESFAALVLFLHAIAGGLAANDFQRQDIRSCPADRQMGWRKTMGADTQGAVLVQTRFTQKSSAEALQFPRSSSEKLPLASPDGAALPHAASESLTAARKRTAADNATKHQDAKIAVLQEGDGLNGHSIRDAKIAVSPLWDSLDEPSAVSCLLVLMSVPAMVFFVISTVLMYSFVQDKKDQAARLAEEQSKLKKPFGQPHFLRKQSGSSYHSPTPSVTSETSTTASTPSHFFIGEVRVGSSASLSASSSEPLSDEAPLPPSLPLVQPACGPVLEPKQGKHTKA
mmetsp:Transcript_109210/g.189503  ORF Transcript_109210/g.189503 Transcript_109210/m.189503 type:complete len:292 (+) Transcript_109210:95-970(+)